MTDLGILELHAHLRDIVERFDLESCAATSILGGKTVTLTVSRSGLATIRRDGLSFAFNVDDELEGDRQPSRQAA